MLLSGREAEAQRFPFTDQLPEKAEGWSFSDIQKTAKQYWKDHPELLEEHDGSYSKYQRWEWFWEQRTYGSDKFPANDHNYKAWAAFVEKNGDLLAKTASSTGQWQPLGPNRLDAKTSDGLGRLNCIAFHPADPNTFWVGSPAGGLWKTTNFGQTWTNMTNNLPVLGVSDIAIHPNNPDIIYIATGDGDLGSLSGIQIDLPFQDGDTRSVGVMKSVNGGVTWERTGMQFSESNRVTIRRLLMSPANPDILIAASSIGLLRTVNGGTAWQQVVQGYFMDIEYHPTNPNIVYAATFGGGQSNPTTFARSIDGGATWQGIFSDPNIRRIKIGVSPAQPDRVDVLCANLSNGLYGIFSSVDAGANFNAGGYVPDSIQGLPNLLGWYDGSTQNRDFFQGQGHYDLAYAISPTNSAEIYVGGVNTWKTTNSGAAWKLSNFWINDPQIIAQAGAQGVGFAHADKHFLRFHPLRNDHLFECNDGGLWYSSDKGTTWTSITNGLEISQIYRLSHSVQEPNTVIIGRQDNGTYILENGGWRKAFGGDGMECLIDHSNPNIMYHSVFNGNFSRSMNRFREPVNQRAWISGNIPGFGQQFQGPWVTAFEIDPVTPSTIYTAMYHVWKSTNRGDSWTQISPLNVSSEKTDNNGNPLPIHIRAMDVSPADPNVIYIGTFEDISATFNGGADWQDIGFRQDNNLALTDIEAHPSNKQVCFITLSGYVSGEKVYGWIAGEWINLSRNLPNVPINCVTYDERGDGGIFVGTDIGVFHLSFSNDNEQWQPCNSRLPRVPVTDLEIHKSTGKLRAATFGRGVWETDLGNVGAADEEESGTGMTITTISDDGLYLLSLESQKAGEEYLIFNYLGERVLQGEVHGLEQEIDLRTLPNGIYYLSLKSEGYKDLHKVVKRQ